MSVFSLGSDFPNCPLNDFLQLARLDQNPIEIHMLYLVDTLFKSFLIEQFPYVPFPPSSLGLADCIRMTSF